MKLSRMSLDAVYGDIGISIDTITLFVELLCEKTEAVLGVVKSTVG